MIEVSNADRIVFPEVGRTKGDVVAYYERVASRALPYVEDRPLSMRRYPKGIAAPGFFQKNVPGHYPESIGRFEVPRSRAAAKKRPHDKDKDDVTVYPVLREAEHLPYLANQGAIELHVPTARVSNFERPDRFILDLDPPPGALDQVRRAARAARDVLARHGLATVPVATGSKGYHLVASILPTVEIHALALAAQKVATLLSAEHPDDLTTVFRIAGRGSRVFIDWLRNLPMATAVAPFSLRAKPRASVAVPLGWGELDSTSPDAFTIADVDRILDRPDPLADLARSPIDAGPFVEAVEIAFDRSGLQLETFDRFRS
jgi:bifunctional non-homologous end joining protein LigD